MLYLLSSGQHFDYDDADVASIGEQITELHEKNMAMVKILTSEPTFIFRMHV